MRRSTASIIVLLAVVVAACGGNSPTTDQPGSGGGEPGTPPAEYPELVADWRDGTTVALPNGWTVAPCEGDAPLLCVADGDRHVGVIELSEHPLDPVPDDVEALLNARADDFLETMRADRVVGCPELRFEAAAATPWTVGGEPGVRAGYRLVDDEDREIERHVLYWAVHDDALFVVTIAAYADDGCLERLGEFTPEDLGVIDDYLDHLIAQTPLPPATPMPPSPAIADGEVVARIVAVDLPVKVITVEVVDLLTGDEAIAAARADGVIGPDDDLPNDFYVRSGTHPAVDVSVEDASVTVIDCVRLCEPVAVSLDDFLSGRRTAMNGEHAIFDLTIENGRAVAIAEIYLP